MNKKWLPITRKNTHLFGLFVLILGQILTPFLTTTPVYAASFSGSDALGQYSDVNNSWQNGNLGNNNSAYKEGESVPFRSVIRSAAIGSANTLDIEYDNIHSGKHGYDYITSFDRDRSPDPCQGQSCTLGNTGTPGDIPTDPTLPQDIKDDLGAFTGEVSIWGGDITNVEYLSTPGHATNSDKSTSIRISFTATSSDVVLAWGGHIAQESDWGIDQGASSISGSPYHMRTLAINGSSVGSRDRSLQPSAVILLPRISITKIVEGGDAEPHDFSFNVSPAIDGESFFYIEENEDTLDIFNVPDGSYSITENAPPGYAFLSGTGDNCTFDNSTATATVSSGTASNIEHAQCTFTNTQVPGSITIKKATDPEGSTQEFNFTTSIDSENSFTLSDGEEKQFSNLADGSYTFTESVLDDWTLKNIVCDTSNYTKDMNLGSVTVNLLAGENVTCTFENEQMATLIVEKIVDPEEATGSFTFTGDVAGTIELPGNNQLTTKVEPGTYTSTETTPDNWELGSIVCDDDNSTTPSTGNVDTATATFNVEAGDVVTCTFSNIEFGSIQVLKDVDTNGDGHIDISGATNWQWTLNDGDNRNTGDNPISVAPNKTYTIAEIMKDDFHVSDVSCNIAHTGGVSESIEVTVSPGQDVVCRFTNTRDTGFIVVEKILNPVNTNGLFNLLVNGNVEKADASHQDKTDPIRVPTNVDHAVSETAGTNTNLNDYISRFECNNNTGTNGIGTSTNVQVDKNQTVTCTFTNELKDLTLTIDKQVNSPVAKIGDIVQYSLIVTNDSDGVSHNTLVTDLPPEGFTVMNNTTSATINGNPLTLTSQPNYSSPGIWGLGTLMPGDVVVLTYLALVTSNVDPGDYPDLAYAQGNMLDESTVFSNVHLQESQDNPFVGVSVLIEEEPVVEASFVAETISTVTHLPVTGGQFIWLPSILAALFSLLFSGHKQYRNRSLKESIV